MLIQGIKNFHPVSFQNDEVFQKVGNSIAFLAARIPDLFLLKLSKLLYILDEQSIKEIGMPVTGLEYKVAKMGPLATDVWSSLRYQGGHFNGFIQINNGSNRNWVKISPHPTYRFNENLFTEFELELLEKIVQEYGSKQPQELVDHTHSANSPWLYTKEKHNINFADDEPNVTDFLVDFSTLLNTAEKKKNFDSFFESLSF